MTNEEVLYLQKKLKISASKLFPKYNDQESLVQEGLLNFFLYEKKHGKKSKKTCDQQIIDSFRKHNGRNRSSGELSGKLKMSSVAGTQEIYEGAIRELSLPCGGSSEYFEGMRECFMKLKIFIEEKMSLDAVEKAYINACLEHFDGNRTRTAEFLKISLRCLRDKISTMPDAPKPKTKKHEKTNDKKHEKTNDIFSKIKKLKKLWQNL